MLWKIYTLIPMFMSMWVKHLAGADFTDAKHLIHTELVRQFHTPGNHGLPARTKARTRWVVRRRRCARLPSHDTYPFKPH